MTAREFCQTPDLTDEQFAELKGAAGFTGPVHDVDVPPNCLAQGVCRYGNVVVHQELNAGACLKNAVDQLSSELFRLGVAYGRLHPVEIG